LFESCLHQEVGEKEMKVNSQLVMAVGEKA